MVAFATGVGGLYHPRSRFTEAARNLVFRGLQRIPGGRDYILQMKYKPVPRYREGFVSAPGRLEKGSLVGCAFPQPLVQLLDGGRVRLDDIFGQRIAILGLAPGLAESLCPGTTALLRRTRAVLVQSHPPPAYRRAGQFDPASRAPRDDVEIIDVYDLEGALRDLLLARPRDEAFVIRPDRYVAAASSLAGLDSVVRDLFTRLGEGAAAVRRVSDDEGGGPRQSGRSISSASLGSRV